MTTNTNTKATNAKANTNATKANNNNNATAITKATENMTPYKAARFVNAALTKAGLEKQLPPQMFYNYTTGRINKGKAPLIEVEAVETTNARGERITQHQIKAEALNTWLANYLAKQATKQAEETKQVAAEVDADA